MSDPAAAAETAGRCGVCNCARPAGSHYGVVTCHACKSFFKRTVQFSLSYACMRKPRHCALTSEQSRACGACRFRKCLRAGMRPALVRSLAPDVRGQLQQRGPPIATGFRTQQQQQHSLVSNGLSRPASADQQQLRGPPAVGIRADVPDLDPVGIDTSLSSAESADSYDQLTVNVLRMIDQYLAAIVLWAKRLPSFHSLPLTDRVLLLQRRWLDVIVLQVAYDSQPYTDTLRLCGGFSLSEAQESQLRQRPRAARHARRVAQRVGQLRLRHPELLQLRAIFLLETSGPPGDWADLPAIDDLQRLHLRALMRECPCPVRRSCLLMLNSDLAAIRLTALAFFDRALNLDGRLPPPLAGEILRATLADDGVGGPRLLQPLF